MKFQSGLRKYHSTETALLKAQNDILMSRDNKAMILLVLLALSAAFDTIEHSILLNVLQQDFGVVGTALNWFDSFLSGRKQRILVGDKTSDDFNLNCGVPREVVWGLYYSLSTSPASSTLFLSISLPFMVMLTTPRFTCPSDLALSIPKLTLSPRLRCALLMFVLGLMLIV